MVNWKSKYLKYKLKYKKLTGSGTCASGECEVKEVKFKQYICLLESPGVAYRNNPTWSKKDKIDTPPGPNYPDIVDVIEKIDGWIKTNHGWLPLKSPDGKQELFKELSLDDKDIVEALDMDISVNVKFNGVKLKNIDYDKSYNFNINPMWTVRTTLFNILWKHTKDLLGDLLDVSKFVMIFADEELNHSTRIYQAGIRDEAIIEIDGASELIMAYEKDEFYKTLRKHREELGRPY